MSQPFPAVLGGRWSALEGGYQSNDSNGLRLPSPTAYGNLAAWYDVSDYSSLVVDGSNRVSLIADKSGNSATNCLCLNGTSANFASVPDSVPLSITSDLEIRVRHSMVDWTPASAPAVISKWSTLGGNRSYGVQVETNGRLTLFWSEDGTALKSVTSTAAPSVSDLGTISWRITLDVNDGAGNHVVTFYTATDFSSWVQLGNVVTTAGTTSIFDGNASLDIGRLNSSGGALNGIIYRAQIYNGIAGTLVFDANFATASKLATSFTESSSNAATVTINSSGDLGARISGERDLVQLTASKQPIYLPWSGTNYGWVNGVAGNLFSTPDSAGISVTGDIDLRCFVSADDYTPSGYQILISKFDGTNPGSSYQFGLDTASSGRLVYQWGTGAAVSALQVSSVGTGFTDRTDRWLRVTHDVDDGAGGNVVRFWTSTDGTNWDQLGTTITNVGTTSIGDSTTVLRVGAATATLFTFTGRIYRAQVLNGIGGTVVADFDPSLYTSGTTFTASTGEVWTLNGGATIVNRTSLYFDGSDDYMKAAAFSLSQPETVYFTGQQVSWTDAKTFYDGNAASSMQLRQRASSPQLAMNAGSLVFANGNLALGTSGVITSIFNGASSALRVNRTTASAGDAGSTSANGYTIGANAVASGGSYGNIRTNEVAIYAAAHDTSVQDRVIQYAGRKWGISGV